MVLAKVRYVLVFAFLLTFAALTLPAPALAEDEEPLVAWILDGNGIHCEAMTVQQNQQFTLYAYATGGFVPYIYVWKEGELVLSTISVLTYAFLEPGNYIVTLIVRDMVYQEATDSVFLTVLPSLVSVGPSTWGAIKELYR